MNETPVVSFPLLTHEVDICARVGPPYPLSCSFPSHTVGCPVLSLLISHPRLLHRSASSSSLPQFFLSSASFLLEQFLVRLLKVIKLSRILPENKKKRGKLPRHLIQSICKFACEFGSCVIALVALLYLLLAPCIHLAE
jgi:hypothetical protein